MHLSGHIHICKGSPEKKVFEQRRQQPAAAAIHYSFVLLSQFFFRLHLSKQHQSRKNEQINKTDFAQSHRQAIDVLVMHGWHTFQKARGLLFFLPLLELSFFTFQLGLSTAV
jgi:hypothetical protein